MDNLINFLFDQSETEEFSTPILGIDHVMDLDDLEDLFADEQ